MSDHQILGNRLIDLGKKIETKTAEDLRHPQQTDIPEWQGADVIITSDFTGHVSGYLGHDLMVRSRHAQPLTWLFFELRMPSVTNSMRETNTAFMAAWRKQP